MNKLVDLFFKKKLLIIIISLQNSNSVELQSDAWRRKLTKKYIIINNRFCSPQLSLIFSAESAVLIASELSYQKVFY